MTGIVHRYFITAYSPIDDSMIGAVSIPDGVTMEGLRTVITPDPDDPMFYACYRLTFEQAQRLSPLLSHMSLESKERVPEFFLETDAV
ncbi:DUF7683 domain-containing protein [Pandoraea terrae]|uniref:DUF7683 domain-containing protein n=1 Tax=Pandoraea terrae TaxID=1537710 RepID=UPI0012406970|nr:hypothetical protein [Pandoraea terrae]